MPHSSRPLVTIGLPYYNSRDTIGDAIRSIFAQTYENWELILVDDGSVDGSSDFAEAIHDERVRLVRHTDNRKLAYRLNELAQLANGKYLARMDADDICHPQRIQRQVDYLESYPSVDLLDSGTYVIAWNGDILGTNGLHELEATSWNALRKCLLRHVTITGKTQWFLDNPYDTSLVRRQDWELWVRSCHHSIFRRLVEPLVFVREGAPDARGKDWVSRGVERVIMRRHGPRVAGRPTTLRLVLSSYAKSILYQALSTIGKENLVISRRFEAMSEEELADARKALETVRATEIPGLK